MILDEKIKKNRYGIGNVYFIDLKIFLC